jgi:hypothetical protein
VSIDNRDNSNLSLMPLMRAQMAAEFALAHSPWHKGDPPAMGTYITYCRNGDGAEYQAMHYWHNEWHSAGPFVKVLRWAHKIPDPVM